MSELECRICRWSRISIRVVIVATIAIGGLSFLFPSDVLSSSRLLTMFCNVMAIFFPTIDLFTNTSNFPEITRLYMSLMLMFFPFAVLMPLCEFSREKRLLIPLPSKDTPEGKKYVRSATVMVLVLPLLIYFQWFVNPGLDIFWMDFSRSRADLAWFGFAITLVTPFFIGMFLHLAVRFFVEAKPIN